MVKKGGVRERGRERAKDAARSGVEPLGHRRANGGEMEGAGRGNGGEIESPRGDYHSKWIDREMLCSSPRSHSSSPFSSTIARRDCFHKIHF